MKTYPADFDLITKIMTTAAGILIIPLAYYFYQAYIHMSDPSINKTLLLIGFCMILLMMPIIYLWHVKHYVLDSDRLIIKRPISDKVILFSEIAQVFLPDQDEFKRTIRIFGVGGIFGFYGKFYNTHFGSMTWYVTQNKNRILIELKSGKKMVISPDDVELCEAIKSKLTHA
jgi:hypothetical protein